MRCCNRALLAARRQRQHMVFFQKPYDSRIDAGFMFGFLRPGAFRCILRISGFFRYTGLFPGRSCLFPAFPGALPVSRMASILVLPRACYRTVPDPGFPACRPADVPCLSLRPFSPLFRCLRCCRLRDDERIELRDALPVLHVAVQFGHDTVAHEFERRAVLVRDRFGRFLGIFSGLIGVPFSRCGSRGGGRSRRPSNRRSRSAAPAKRASLSRYPWHSRSGAGNPSSGCRHV